MSTSYPVKYFTSAMRDAPQLNGTAGSLNAVLHACLVTGFGAVVPSAVSVADGIATATVSAGTGFAEGAILEISGATPAALNGQARALAGTSTTVRWATSAPSGEAGGTIAIKAAPAGWARIYSGTNQAAWQSINPMSTGGVLYVDDTGTKNARVRAYEAMTDLGVGTGPAPTDAQISGGLYWPKSDTADATAREWNFAADDRFFMLAVRAAGQPWRQVVCAGDLLPAMAGDIYAFYVSGMSRDVTGLTDEAMYESLAYSTLSTAQSGGGFCLRNSMAASGAVLMYRRAWGAAINSYITSVRSGSADYAWGNATTPVDQNLRICGVAVLEGVSGPVRGAIPGLRHILQDVQARYSTGDVLHTAGAQARNHVLWRCGPPKSEPSHGIIAVDLTGPWREGAV